MTTCVFNFAVVDKVYEAVFLAVDTEPRLSTYSALYDKIYNPIRWSVCIRTMGFIASTISGYNIQL